MPLNAKVKLGPMQLSQAIKALERKGAKRIGHPTLTGWLFLNEEGQVVKGGPEGTTQYYWADYVRSYIPPREGWWVELEVDAE